MQALQATLAGSMLDSMSQGEAGEPTLSRRELLKFGAKAGFLVIGGGVVATYGVAIGEAAYHEYTKHDEAAAEVKARAETIARRVKEGMAYDWKYGSVWPGLAILPSSVDLYRTPSLHPATKINWPGKPDEHLIAQRPFMIKGSLDVNTNLNESRDGIGDETMGFWLPNSEDIVFLDRSAHRFQILMPTHTAAAVFRNDYQDIVGEPVALEPAVERNGVTWRYINSEVVYLDGSQGSRRDAIPIHKVCGRSGWADQRTATAEYNDFQTGNLNPDFITLPEG